MADTAEAKALSILQPPDNFAPDTSSVASLNAPFGAPQAHQTEEEKFRTQNTQDVPLDMSLEVPAGVRFKAELRPTPQDKLAFLNEYFRTEHPYFYGGKAPARIASNGEILIRVPTEKGPRDIPLNKPGVSGNDFAGLAAYAPQTAAAIAGTVATKKIPGISKLAEMFPKTMASVGSAVGASAEGAVQDVAVRASDNQPIQLGEIAARRGAEIPVNMLFDAVIAAGTGATKMAVSPFGSGPMDEPLGEAVEYFKREHGVDFPLTAAEKTGSPLLKRTEATMERLPGSSKSLTEIKEQKREAFGKIQESMLGGKPTGTDETVGREATSLIRSKLEALGASAEQNRLNVVQLANQRLLESMDSAFPAAKQVLPERVGGGIRARVLAEYDTLREEAARRYGALESLPGGSDRVLESPGLAGKAAALLDKLSGAETPAGTLTLREFLPEGAEAMLQRLASAKDAKFSLRDLIQARSGLDAKIAKETAGIPSVKLKELSDIRQLLSDSIDEAVDSIPDKRLRDAYKDTTKWYSEQRQRFDDVVIKKMFNDFDKSGGIRDEDIVRNIGLSEYQVLKKFLGPDSPEFQSLRRSIGDSVIDAATTPSGMVDGKSLLKELSEVYKTKRSIAEDVFGKKGTQLPTQLQRLGELLSDVDAQIDPEKFKSLLASDKPLATAVKGLLDDQKTLNAKFRSDILKSIADGKLGKTDFDAAKFVDLVYKEASPSEVQAVVNQLKDAPDTLQKLKQKVAERIFFDAQRAAKEVDPARLGSGEVFRQPASAKLEQVFGSDLNKEKLRIILGDTTLKDFQELGKLLRAGEVSEGAFSSAGSLSAGAAVAGMIRNGPFAYAADWAKQKLAGIAITTPLIRQYFANTAARRIPFDEAAQILIASEPFARAATESLGPEGAQEFINALDTSVQRFVGQKQQQENRAGADAEQKALKILTP